MRGVNKSGVKILGVKRLGVKRLGWRAAVRSPQWRAGALPADGVKVGAKVGVNGRRRLVGRDASGRVVPSRGS